MSAGRRPSSRSASCSESHEVGTPASMIVSRALSSTRYQFVCASSTRWTPSATCVCSILVWYPFAAGESARTGAQDVLLPAAAADDEPALGERRERGLERGEVTGEQEVDRPAGGAGAPHPAAQDRRARLLLGVGEQVEEDRELWPVIEVTGDHREGVGTQHRQELLVGESEQLLQPRGAGRAQSGWFSPGRAMRAR